MNRRKTLLFLLGTCLMLSGCTQFVLEDAAETASENVQEDFRELGEETTKSIEEDSLTNEEQLTSSRDMMDLEESAGPIK